MRMSLMQEARRPVHLGLATDIGAGTSFSMLATMGEAYKVQMLAGHRPSAFELFHMATRGNAGRLRIADQAGSIESGKFADLVVLDPAATPVLASRRSFREFACGRAVLADDPGRRPCGARHLCGGQTRA